MKLLLQRQASGPGCTHGDLYVDGRHECVTLEDIVRPDGIKIPGETAIPAGTYRLDITFSPRFKRDLPLLINVGGFIGVRIHTGNTADDTEGCVLVGRTRAAQRINDSRLAFDALFAKLLEARARGEAVSLTVLNAEARS